MKLGELSTGIGELVDPGCADLDINHITHDSQKVQYGSIFIAIEGQHNDGHDYIACASQLGAVCIATNRPERVPCNIPTLKLLDHPRAAMAALARRLYGYPDQQVRIIGITGTNGKTTGTYLVQNLLQPAVCGRIGTLTYFNGLAEEKSLRTTPESCDLFRSLGEMVANGCHYAAMEISSHGLMLQRVLGLGVHYALFTNLTQDHLDYHKTMEDYFAAKNLLFTRHLVEGGTAIVNWDDAYGRRLTIPPHARLIRMGQAEDADLRFVIDELSVMGSRFTVHFQGGAQEFHVPLLGIHNVYNYCGALAVAVCEGKTMAELAAHTDSVCAVPGRSEMINLGQNYGVMVDFAHSPDALKNVLTACRQITQGRLIVVFGAGGDRDPSKRPLMGQMAHAFADVVILTSDNPRTEDPESIMDMVQQGIPREPGEGFMRNWDRTQAISEAIHMANSGDLVLLAGKGHETTQEINRNFHPFDDRQVAARFIRARQEQGK